MDEGEALRERPRGGLIAGRADGPGGGGGPGDASGAAYGAAPGTDPPHVSLHGPLAAARFVERPNRFLVRCRLAGEGEPAHVFGEVPAEPPPGAAGDLVEAHLPDPGRLHELLVPGRQVLLRPAAAPGRKTDWTAVLTERPGGGGWVSVDTTLPNRLVGRALRRGALEELAGWELEAAEVTVGGSRFDFVLRRAGRPDPTSAGRVDDAPERMALEVKSVTLVEEGVGLFPDAVTARGARHVTELAGLVRSGEWAAAVLFLAQRDDVEAVTAAPEIDADFAAALAAAREAGVRVLARRCRVDRERVRLGARIPVRPEKACAR